MSSRQKINSESEDKEINEIYEKYRDEIIRISSDLKIEEFKEKLNKLREKENIVSRIKSLNEDSKTNINFLKKENEISNDRKTTIDYFDSCLEVF